jgi:cyclophilin family peptidyl-prolyl cis-trans isomerase
MKTLFKSLLMLAAVFFLTLVSAEKTASNTAAAEKATKAPPVYVKLVTNKGDILLELYPDKAPKTVANFVQYVNDGFYNGTIFHRVIPNFMIQGGGFDRDLMRKPTRAPIQNEAANGLKNLRGTIAMARTGDPHSATAQFFINVQDNPALDYTGPQNSRTWGYAVFGKVVDGMDTVDTIRFQPTEARGPFRRDVPVKDMIIKQAMVVEKPASLNRPKDSPDKVSTQSADTNNSVENRP